MKNSLKKRVERLNDHVRTEVPLVAIITKEEGGYMLTLSEAGRQVKETKSTHGTMAEVLEVANKLTEGRTAFIWDII